MTMILRNMRIKQKYYDTGVKSSGKNWYKLTLVVEDMDYPRIKPMRLIVWEDLAYCHQNIELDMIINTEGQPPDPDTYTDKKTGERRHSYNARVVQIEVVSGSYETLPPPPEDEPEPKPAPPVDMDENIDEDFL